MLCNHSSYDASCQRNQAVRKSYLCFACDPQLLQHQEQRTPDNYNKSQFNSLASICSILASFPGLLTVQFLNACSFCTLQAIKNWMVGRSRNKAMSIHSIICDVSLTFDYPCAGSLTVISLTYNDQSRTLTCTSTGGPATTVTWRRDGIVITLNATYQQTMRLVDPVNGTYQTVLTIDPSVGWIVGTYNCTVENVRGESSETVVVPGETRTMYLNIHAVIILHHNNLHVNFLRKCVTSLSQ